MSETSSIMASTAMHRLLHAESVAVIGASEDRGKFGGRLIYNLLHHDFQGMVYPVNPKRMTILGLKAYSDITAVPSPPDVAVVAVGSPIECRSTDGAMPGDGQRTLRQHDAAATQIGRAADEE